MKTGLIILIAIHALIHLIGFLKAFWLLELPSLKTVSQSAGILWIISSLLLIVFAVLLATDNEYWYIAGICSVCVSQAAIFTSWKEAKYGTIINVILLVVSIIGYFSWNYQNKFRQDVLKRLDTYSKRNDELLSESDLDDLPEPVKKYIRISGGVGKPKVQAFKVTFKGAIRKNEGSEWMPFTSEQYNFMKDPTRLFFMKATMMHLPVAGYHRYVKGSASMDIRLLSVFRVQYADGNAMNEAETVTFFNDMCCMAPATLIDERIKWMEIKGDSVHASISCNGICIKAWLIFSDTGELLNFTSDDRLDSNAGEKLPWSTPLKKYVERNGYNIASEAETIYSYPSGDFCYGKFQLENVEYNPVNSN